MLTVALGEVFIERYAEQFGEPGGNERREIPGLVATLGRGNEAPVAVGEGVAEDLPDKVIHTLGKFFDHTLIRFYLGESASVNRLLPERNNPESRIAVGNSHLVRGEVAASLGLLYVFRCRTFLVGEKVFGLVAYKRSIKFVDFERWHFDV